MIRNCKHHPRMMPVADLRGLLVAENIVPIPRGPMTIPNVIGLLGRLFETAMTIWMHWRVDATNIVPQAPNGISGFNK